MFLKQIYRLFLVASLVTIGMIGMGNAATLSYDFTIQYLQGPGTNPYGMGLGDTVTVDVTFNEAEGHKEIDLNLSSHSLSQVIGPNNENTYDPALSLTLSFSTLASITYDQEDDPLYLTYPIVTFNTFGNPYNADSWTFNVIDFWVEDDELNSWIKIGILDTNNPIIMLNAGGVDDQNNPWHLSSVPEPATIALFGLGLLGLAGISRRSRQ